MTYSIEGEIAALPCWSGRPSITPLTGGLSNRQWIVTQGGRRCVVRTRRPAPQHGVDRAREARIAALAGELGIGPRLVLETPRFLVSAYIDGETAARAATDPERLFRFVGEAHRAFDRSAADYGTAQMPMDILRGYLTSLSQAQADARATWAEMVARLAPLLAGRPVGFTHNDLHPGNIIDDGRRLWLIDWEFAGLGDPLLDVASLINNLPDGVIAEASVVPIWAGGVADAAIDRRLMPALRAAAALRDYLWGVAEQNHRSASRSLQAYIIENWDRVVRCFANLPQ